MNNFLKRNILKFKLYNLKNCCWSTEPMTIYPNSPIIKDDHILLWWTGLVDANRKEIYVGDIVRTIDDHLATIFSTTKYTRGQVTWLNESFSVCQSYVGASYINEYVQCDCCPAALEIIGNRFDNPELLEECPIAKSMRLNNEN